MEEELYEAKQSQLELMQQCQDLDNELSTAHCRVYVPKRGDAIDQELGRFLNTYPEREQMKILFLRESEGVYQFGSRRVYVKIEKGNQVLVRVGGGYMHIEDFIQQYTPEETEKRGRKDASVRFRRKLSVQRISRRQSVTARESSPIAVPQRPPALAGSPKFTPVLKRTAYKEASSPVAKKKPATTKNRKSGAATLMARASPKA